jgi:hypothetical protein
MAYSLPTADVAAPVVLVPGAASASVPDVGRSNNNLDALDFQGRRYFAWRTAPSHFASADAVIHLVSTVEDASEWRLDLTISMGRDVREPRLFEFDGKLFLYFFTLGADWSRFEPDRIWVCALQNGVWSDPAPASPATGYVVWRVRVLGGVPIMSVYNHAGALYTRDPVPTTVEFWTSTDGLTWGPLGGDKVLHVGGTETDVVDHPDDGWIAVTRKEGPSTFGSDIAHIPDLRRASWRVRSVPEKLDSPCMFRWRRHVLLVARRTVGFRGAYDLQLPEIDDVLRTKIYHRVYWSTPKRTALWAIDPTTLELAHVADLPGKGDTCFPAVVQESDDVFRVYNYTSPLDGPDLPWVAGQWGDTCIYETAVTLSER